MRDTRQNLTHFHELLAELSQGFCPAAASVVALEHPGLTRNTDLVHLIAVGAEVVPYDALPVRGRALRHPLR